MCFSTVKANLSEWKRFKNYSVNSFYPPIEVVRHNIKGFIVKAVMEIQSNIFIVQYAGDVNRFTNRPNEANDSMFNLFSPDIVEGKDRDEYKKGDLLIIPERRGNIAKYISGINIEGKKNELRKVNMEFIINARMFRNIIYTNYISLLVTKLGFNQCYLILANIILRIY